MDKMPGIDVDVERIRTNIVYFDFNHDALSAEEFLRTLEGRGIRFLRTGKSRFRMVTHYGISADDIDIVLQAMRDTLRGA
jgi:threonine aldolase